MVAVIKHSGIHIIFTVYLYRGELAIHTILSLNLQTEYPAEFDENGTE